METRIKHKEGIGYFAQVKVGLFFWKTIGKHINGYGLCSEDHEDYPKEDLTQAETLLTSYLEWKTKQEGKVTYLHKEK